MADAGSTVSAGSEGREGGETGGRGGGGGGGGGEGGGGETPDTLLKKLEEQNRLLESDRKSRTAIGRSGSFRSISDTDSVNSLRIGLVTDEHLMEVMSSPKSHDQSIDSPAAAAGGGGGRGGGGGGGGENDSLVRLRTESEMSGEVSSTGSKSPNLGAGEDGGGEGGGGGGGGRRGDPDDPMGGDDGEDVLKTWSVLLRNWEDNMRKNGKQVRQRAREGIPGALRGMAWQLMCGAQDHNLRDRYPVLLTEESPFERQIKRDLARTFPEHSFFKERDGLGQESLLNILKAYSVYDREVGYCQGSPFITGLLLMQKMPEEDAFCVFVRLMYDYKLRDLFKPSMADLGLCFYQLEKLAEELYPTLYAHFQSVEFMTSMYASPWFLTMFASTLSLNVVFRIVDIFLIEGREVVFKVGLALLEHSQETLLQMDMEEMLKHFQKEMKSIHEGDPDQLMKKAQRIKLNPRKMKKLEKDYQVRRERQAMENMELLRLQQSNLDLQKSVKSLEKECSSLADKLIQGQVSRAQEAEEMFIIKKELAKTRRKLAEHEERQSRKESMESNESLHEDSPKIVNGGGKGDDGGEDVEEGEEEKFVIDCGPELTVLEDEETAERLQVVSPDHVTREEAQQVLRKLGVQSPETPNLSPVVEGDENHHGNTTNKTSNGHPPSGVEVHLTPSLSPDPNPTTTNSTAGGGGGGGGERRRRRSSSTHDTSTVAVVAELRRCRAQLEERMSELAHTKLELAEATSVMEQKRMEAKQALLRESQAVREVDAARNYITVLEQRLSESQMEKLSCPHCSKKLGSSGNNADSHDLSSSSSSSSDVLFSHLRAMWNSSVAPPGSGSPSRTPRFGPSWT